MTDAGAPELLPVVRNPVRQLAAGATWRAAGYLVGHLVLGLVMFATTLPVLAVAGILAAVTWAGVPLLLGAGYLVRGYAALERRRTRIVGGVGRIDGVDGVGSAAAATTGPSGGALSRLRAMWRDRVTTRAAAFLVVLYVPLLLVDVLALVLFAAGWTAVTLPLWYWAVSSPGVLIGYELHGDTVGLRVTDLPVALGVAVAGLALAAAAAPLVTFGATVVRGAARALLGPHRDPLAAAHRILRTPGPLHLPAA